MKLQKYFFFVFMTVDWSNNILCQKNHRNSANKLKNFLTLGYVPTGIKTEEVRRISRSFRPPKTFVLKRDLKIANVVFEPMIRIMFSHCRFTRLKPTAVGILRFE